MYVLGNLGIILPAAIRSWRQVKQLTAKEPGSAGAAQSAFTAEVDVGGGFTAGGAVSKLSRPLVRPVTMLCDALRYIYMCRCAMNQCNGEPSDFVGLLAVTHKPTPYSQQGVVRPPAPPKTSQHVKKTLLTATFAILLPFYVCCWQAQRPILPVGRHQEISRRQHSQHFLMTCVLSSIIDRCSQ